MTQSGARREVTGVILTGGKSRRLGQDKVLLPYRGEPLVLHVHRILVELFPRVILVGHPRPELEALGLACIPDQVPGQGVLGGITTALDKAATPYIFVAGADMPFLTPSLISGILRYRAGADAVIPIGPRGLEPLCAVYSASCAPSFRQSLLEGVRRIVEALEGFVVLSPKIVPKEGEPDPFININRPEDLKILKNGSV